MENLIGVCPPPLFLDTNVLLLGLLWRRPAYALLEQVRNGSVTFISSPELFAELAEVIDPPPLSQPVCRDPDDDAVLALARAALADVIVSGDDDSLSLASFDDIPILSPAQALARVGDWP